MFLPPSLTRRLRRHLSATRRHTRGEAGYTTETVLITALLAILGLTVVGIITAKVVSKAHGIDLG